MNGQNSTRERASFELQLIDRDRNIFGIIILYYPIHIGTLWKARNRPLPYVQLATAIDLTRFFIFFFSLGPCF